MQPAAPNRARLRSRILERFAHHADASHRRTAALNVFFELSFEYDSLRHFRSLCVLIPHLCLDTPASLYLETPQLGLRLLRTSGANGQESVLLPESPCGDAPAIRREAGGVIVSICAPDPGSEPLGALRLHRDIPPGEDDFWLEYASWTARIMAVIQTSVSNRRRLAFVNNLIRDIGHNVIVPNMQFKLFFLQMERQIDELDRRIAELAPARSDTADPADLKARTDLPDMVRELASLQRAVSQLFQQTSLFLESLLRPSHFEKGNYVLQLRPCKFKSRILEPQIERFRHMLSAQDIRIEIDPEVRIDQDVELEADIGLMAQVFANLMANAVKYTRPAPRPEGPPLKLLRYGWKGAPDVFGRGKDGIRLYVATSGPEIPPGDRGRLFEEGFRTADAGTTVGSGHGLPFVRQIVELHKGRVEYSREADMNVFSITLPRQRNPAGSEA